MKGILSASLNWICATVLHCATPASKSLEYDNSRSRWTAEGGGANEPFQENFESGWRGVPMLPNMKQPALGGDFYDLPLDEFVFSKKGKGWIETPGLPLMYWQRGRIGEYIVITPDPDEVEAAIHGWLNEWVQEVIDPVDATGVQVRLAGTEGEILSATSQLAPDVVVPLRSKFGSWKIAAWDDRKTVVTHSAPTLAISVGVASVFALARDWSLCGAAPCAAPERTACLIRKPSVARVAHPVDGISYLTTTSLQMRWS